MSAADIRGIDAGPVRAPSPVRPRFEPSGTGTARSPWARFPADLADADLADADRAAATRAAPPERDSPPVPVPAGVPAGSGARFGFSAFLAQSLAQQADAGDLPASAAPDRVAAYRRATLAPPASQADVILPRLSSVRSVDLMA